VEVRLALAQRGLGDDVLRAAAAAGCAEGGRADVAGAAALINV
jgi:hypothetical protein